MTQSTEHHGQGQQLLSHDYDLYLFPFLMYFRELAFGLKTSLPPYTHFLTVAFFFFSKFPVSYFSLQLQGTLDNGAAQWRKDPQVSVWKKKKNLPRK